MNALLLTLFVGTMLLVYGLVAFGFAAKQRDHEQSDRLGLAPLADDVEGDAP